jgi:hypothetical protein
MIQADGIQFEMPAFGDPPQAALLLIICANGGVGRVLQRLGWRSAHAMLCRLFLQLRH